MSATIPLYGRTIDRNGSDLSLQLYEILRLELLRGRWDVGARMPSYKDIAEQTGLHQCHIQRAFDRLDDEGYVERFRHRGIFVKTTTTPSNETLGKVLLVVPQQDIVRDRYGDHRISIETQGFGLVDAYSVVWFAEQLGLQMEVCPVPLEAECLPGQAPDADAAPLFGILSLMPAQRLQTLRHPDCQAPVVYLGTDDRHSAPCLTGDPYRAAYRVTEELLGFGHKRLAVISDPHLHPEGSEAAFEGIAMAMSHAGIDTRPDDLPIMRHPGAPIPDGVTAIFCHSIELAQACHQSLASKGVRVPEDVSLASMQIGRTRGDTGTTIVGAYYPWEQITSKSFDILLAPEHYRKQGICQLTFEPTVRSGVDFSVAPPSPSRAMSR